MTVDQVATRSPPGGGRLWWTFARGARSPSAHVARVLNVPLEPSFAELRRLARAVRRTAGAVVPDDDALVEASTQLLRIGYERGPRATSRAGIDAWRASGRAIALVPDRAARRSSSTSSRAARRARSLDVRQATEWDAGHLEGSPARVRRRPARPARRVRPPKRHDGGLRERLPLVDGREPARPRGPPGAARSAVGVPRALRMLAALSAERRARLAASARIGPPTLRTRPRSSSRIRTPTTSGIARSERPARGDRARVGSTMPSRTRRSASVEVQRVRRPRRGTTSSAEVAPAGPRRRGSWSRRRGSAASGTADSGARRPNPARRTRRGRTPSRARP